MSRTFAGKVLVFFVAFLLVMQLLLMAPIRTVLAADDITLQIQKTVNMTSVAPGQNFVYTLKYANPSITTDARNVVIEDVLPPELDYVGLDTSIHIQSSGYDPDTRKVTFTFIDPLPAGVTGIVKITAKFKDGVTLDGTTATNTASIDGDNSPKVDSNPVTVTAHVKTPDWNVSKTKTFPSGSIVPVLDSQVTYRVRVSGNTSGGLNLHDIVISDTLPPKSVYVSSNPAGTYDPDTHKVTWDAIANLNVGATADRYVTVRYPSTDFLVSDTVTNHADITAQLYGETTDIPKSAEYTHGFSTPNPQASASFSKSNRQNDDEYAIGQTAIFYINNATNTGNVPLDQFIVSDSVPAEMELTSITTGRYNDVVPLTISYKTNINTDWTSWYTDDTSGGTNTTLNVSTLGLDSGEHITDVQWDFGTVPVGFAPNQSMEIRGTVLDPSPSPLPYTVTNHASLHWSYEGAEHVIPASAHFDIIAAKPWLNPSKSADASTYYYGTRVTYTLRVKNHDYATGNLVNPIAIEALPLQLEDAQFISVTGSSGLDIPTGVNFNPGALEPDKTDSAGRLVFVWRFNETLTPGQYYDIKFSARIKDQTLVGNVPNTFYMTTDDTNDIKPYTGLTTDTQDLDSDGQTDDVMVAASCNIFVKFQGSLESQKWVKGELDTDWHHFTLASPGVGQTMAGGRADYRLTVKNSGSNGPISNIVLIDKLPRVGDTGVVDTSTRGSEWRPYLVNQITCVDGSALLGDYKIYYSTNANPSCTELADPENNTGSGGDGWSESPPADITTVRSLKIDLGNTVLQPDQSITFEWPMRAPYGAPRDIVAWNSFGYGATYSDFANGEEINQPFLPSEPLKVGFQIYDDEPTLVDLGDRVWEDINRNGIQDTGEQGINGVLVKLFYDGQDPETDTPLAYTRTGDNYTAGQGAGWYLFPDIDAYGDYFLTFEYPDSYRATTCQASGGTDATDSDLVNGTETHSGNYYTDKTRTINLTSDDLDMDAGLYHPASLGDHVWNDRNANGIQDAGEPGIAGVTVALTDASNSPVTDADGNTINPTTTDSSGNYLFSNLAPGEFKIHFTLPANYVFTTADAGGDDTKDSDVDAAGVTTATTLLSDEDDMTWDAGMHKAALGDRVWRDSNANGIQDVGENGISGITVTLRKASDSSLVGTATTNGSGIYQFFDLDAGDYFITVTPPTPMNEHIFVTQDAGSDDAKDSDVNASGVSGTITLDAGEMDWTWDAGTYRLPRIGDRVWNDINANGIQDSGETGIANVTVTLYSVGADATAYTGDDTVTNTMVTNASGIYTFTQVPIGNYYVGFTLPANYVFSTANATGDTTDSDADTTTGLTAMTNLAPDENDTTWDAGLHKGAIGDYIWHDTNANGVQDGGETGVNGISVALRRTSDNGLVGTTTTNSSGIYQFTNLDAGDYYVTVTLGGGYNTFVVQDAGSDDAKDSDVNASGRSANINLVAGERDWTWDAGMYKLATIGDKVWNDMDADGVQDAGENGIANVTVTLYSVGADATAYTGDDTSAGTMVTNASGIYTFDQVLPGDYYVQFTLPANYVFSTANATADTTDSDADTGTGRTAATTLSPDETDLTWDAGLHKAALGDYVWHDINANGVQDAGETGVNGITVALRKTSDDSLVGSTTTNASGFYQFLNLDAGDYYINVTLGGGYNAFSVQDAGSDDAKDSDVNTSGRSANINLSAGERDWTWDAGMYKLATIGDRVWNDMDGDGIQDAGENGIANVTVTLYSVGLDGTAYTGDDTSAGTMVTNASGIYTFSQVLPGDYYVQFTLPGGYASSVQDTGSDDTKDSDVNASGRTIMTTLSPEETDLTWDAGLHKGAIGDYVWYDINADGKHDTGEAGINGVVVELHAAADNSLIASTTTATGGPASATGYYEFQDLAAGQYYITVTKPSGDDLFTLQNAGADDTKDSDVNASGTSGTITLAAGQRDLTWDAGIYMMASYGDLVWNDLNTDGIQDAGEGGIPGVTVTLYSAGADGTPLTGDDTTIGTDITDSGGYYSFDHLMADTYYAKFTLPTGYVFSAQDAGSDDAKDSDANISTGYTAAITLAPEETELTWDAGMHRGALGDYVWYDINANGIQDAGEAGINDITVELRAAADNSLIASTTTITGGPSNTAGYYEFLDVAPGQYTLAFTKPAGYDRFSVQDSGADNAKDSDVNSSGVSTTITLAAGQRDWTWDAGLYRYASVGDTYWYDENLNGLQDGGETGEPGRTVTLYKPGADGTAGTADDVSQTTATTDSEGNYLFDNLVPGAYYIRFSLPANAAFTAKDAGDDAQDSDVNSAGNTPVFTLTSGQTDLTQDAGIFYLCSLGDTVWDDLNINGIQDAGEAGVPGVTVKLLSDAGSQLRTTVTDSSGHYAFTGLVPDDYSIQVVKPTVYAGFAPRDAETDSRDTEDSDVDTATGTSVLINLSSGENDMTWDAGLYKLASLGSRVWIDKDKDGIQDKREYGVKGVTVFLYDSEGNLVGQTVTNSKGDYMFTNLMPGDYRVKFILPPGYVFTATGTDPTSGTDSNADVNGDTLPVDLISGSNDVTIDAGVYKGTGGDTADDSYNYIVIGCVMLVFAALLILLVLHRMRRPKKAEK